MLVKLRKNESVENLIKRFIRKVKKEKIIEKILDKKFYKKPSEVRREKRFRRLAVIEKIKRKERQQSRE